MKSIAEIKNAAAQPRVSMKTEIELDGKVVKMYAWTKLYMGI